MLLLPWLWLAAAGAVCRADVIYLANGGRIEGRIVEEKGDVIRIQVRTGVTTVRRSEVERIERRALPEEEVAARRARLGADDVSGRMEVAAAAVAAGVTDVAAELYREVLARQAGHREALVGLRRIIDPEAEKLLAEAEGERAAGRAAAAIGKVRALRKALPETSLLPVARAFLGDLYLADGRPAEAEAEWLAALGEDGHALDLFPGRTAAARRGLERALAEQGNWAEAAAAAEAARGGGADADAEARGRRYRRLEELQPEGVGDSPRARVLERMRLLGALGLDARALSEWRAATAGVRDDPEVADAASRSAEAAGDFALALDLARRAAAAAVGAGAGAGAGDVAERLARLETAARYGKGFPFAAVGGAVGLERLVKSVEAFFQAGDAAGEKAALEAIAAQRPPFAAVEAVVRRGPDPGFDGKTGVRRRPITCPHTKGGTEYVLWVPAGYDPGRAWPLLVSLHPTHGAGDWQLASWGDSLRSADFLVACPSAERKIGLGFSRASQSLVLATVADVKRDFRVDADRVYLDGMSMGAHMCWIMAVAFPDRWAGIAPRAGSPLRVMDLIDNLFGVGVLSLNGDKDEMVPPEAPRKGCARLKELGYDVTYREFAGRGHEYFAEVNDEILAWMGARRREPYPRKVGFVTREAIFARSFWLEVGGVDAGGRQTVLNVQGSDGDKLEERVLMNVPARVGGEVREGEVWVTASANVERVVIWLSDRLLDLDRPVVVHVNGGVGWRGKVERSVGVMLEDAKRRGEREMLFSARVVVPVPGQGGK